MLQYSDLSVKSTGKRKARPPELKMSAAERSWETQWAQLFPDLPAGAYDQRFSQDRQFRFDFSWPDVKVAVEIEGGEYSRGRHTRAAGYQADCEKYNLAADLGWAVYSVTPTMLRRNPANQMGQVASAIRRRLTR